MDKTELIKLMKKEGNFEEFEYSGVPVILIRNTSLLIWCGYFQINRKICRALSKNTKEVKDYLLNSDMIEIHGGFTYFDSLKKHSGKWAGFDCAHCGDLIPSSIYFLKVDENEVYRDQEFAENEIKSAIDEILNNEKNLF